MKASYEKTLSAKGHSFGKRLSAGKHLPELPEQIVNLLFPGRLGSDGVWSSEFPVTALAKACRSGMLVLIVLQ